MLFNGHNLKQSATQQYEPTPPLPRRTHTNLRLRRSFMVLIFGFISRKQREKNRLGTSQEKGEYTVKFVSIFPSIDCVGSLVIGCWSVGYAVGSL